MNRKMIAAIVLFIGFILFLYCENNCIATTNIIVQSNRLPDSFNGYKIIHLSDLHGKRFGKNQKYLVSKIKMVKPDLIVFTGDLIDSRHYNHESSVELFKQVTKIAPVYYVTGNHELSSGRFDELEKILIENGVKVLRNTHSKIHKGNDEIYILGIDDPLLDYMGNGIFDMSSNVIDAITKDISEEDTFKILLAHRPENFQTHRKYQLDIIFSGHAHGGQVRLPFIGGLIAPNQGFFPKYTSGKHIEGNSTMIISRGLGNSIAPQRLFNRPEIIIVKLVNNGK